MNALLDIDHLREAGPGVHALAAFAESFGAGNADEAMVLACQQLRDHVAGRGVPDGLSSYVRAFGIRVLEEPISQAGRLDYEQGNYVIRVPPASPQQRARGEIDPDHALHRQKFSIAHELGHALLMEQLASSDEHLRGLHDPAAWSKIEKLCDLAAAELLVPVRTFLNELSRWGVQIDGVEHIARLHDVSREVILRRFLSAGARAVILWRVRPRNNSRMSVATVKEAYALETGPWLSFAAESKCLHPNLVLTAARLGKSASRNLSVKRGIAQWQLAGVASARKPAISSQNHCDVLLVLFNRSDVTDSRLWHVANRRTRCS